MMRLWAMWRTVVHLWLALMELVLGRPGRAWLRWWHGEGAPHQQQFYRCRTCQILISWHRIHAGGCPCGALRISPAALSLREKTIALMLPWIVSPPWVRRAALARRRVPA